VADHPAGLAARRIRQIVRVAITLAVVLATFVFVLPRVAQLGDVRQRISVMNGSQIAVLSAVAAWNLMAYALVWVACLPGLTVAQGTVSSQASTAVANTVPAGGYLSIGVSYGMFRSWGFRSSMITLAVLISGVWNNLAKLALPVLALALLAVDGDATPTRIAAAGAGLAGLVLTIALFTVGLRSEHFAAHLGSTSARLANRLLRPLGRGKLRGWDAAVVRFRAHTLDLVRARWHWMTVATLASNLSLFLVLLLSLRFVGVSEREVSNIEVFAAFSFTRLVTAIPLTPGSVGVVELALTAALVSAGGARPDVVAGVLVYRGLTYLLPIPLGALAYVYWHRNRSWRRATAPDPDAEHASAELHSSPR
jgi:uncharacterized membrane protein YbhN (UPF0104 family)